RLVALVVACVAVAAAGLARTAGGGGSSFFAAARSALDARTADRSALSVSTKGVQTTPDNQHILVSKDVANERWAISLNADDTITGNVFLCDGSAPAFVWCAVIADD